MTDEQIWQGIIDYLDEHVRKAMEDWVDLGHPETFSVADCAREALAPHCQDQDYVDRLAEDFARAFDERFDRLVRKGMN